MHFVVARLGAMTRQDGPRRGLAVSLAYHAAITNWAAPTGPEGPDLLFRSRAGPA